MLNLDSFQLEHGRESEKILKAYFPEVCYEIKGITDTLNIDYLKFTSWMLAMGCCMYSLDSNIPEIRGYGQRTSLNRFANREEMIVVDIYEDAGKSGKSIEGRPAFKKMFNNFYKTLLYGLFA